MKSLGSLTGCALALACAHESNAVVGLSDTKTQGTVAGEASQPQAASTADAATAAIRPLNVNVPEKALVDLRQRIAATRWPDRETVKDRSQGAQLAKMQALVSYWGTDYDWRKSVSSGEPLFLLRRTSARRRLTAVLVPRCGSRCFCPELRELALMPRPCACGRCRRDGAARQHWICTPLDIAA
jgi:hypothetical protein